jgi:hypothetical protein
MVAVDKVPTTTYKDCSNAEYQLSELAEVNEPNKFDTISEIIDNNEI